MTKTQMTTQAIPVIASRLREARLQAGISQKTMGILAGIDEFTSSARVNQYEQGKHVPDFLTLEKFASVLNVPTEFFYARDNTMAEMLLLFAQLTQKQKSQLISHLKKPNTER